MKLCTVLIPTRARPEGLQRAIASVRATSSIENVDILVKVDDDDLATQHLFDKWWSPGVKKVVGPRGKGYASVCDGLTALAHLADSKWVFQIDDDMTLEGPAWDGYLNMLPTIGYAAQPQFYHLNQSHYKSGSCGVVAWCVPTRCWEDFGYKSLQHPADDFLYQLLIKKHGWKTVLFKGLIVQHDRANDLQLAEHRA